jgi:hypothetical protein
MISESNGYGAEESNGYGAKRSLTTCEGMTIVMLERDVYGARE